MKLAFVLHNYFPFGGLQKNCMNIARACHGRGHTVEFFAGKWEGDQPDWAKVHLVEARGFSNHAWGADFSRRVSERTNEGDFDGIIGFNRMPGLDVYYAADVCFMEKSRQRYGFWYRLTPRYRHYVEFEEAIYGEQSGTQVLLVSATQKENFIRFYHTPDERFHLLPPGIPEACKAGDDAAEVRNQKRTELGLVPAQKAIFLIGSGFRTKGLDRAIEIISLLPPELKESVHLFVVGQDDFEEYGRMASSRGIGKQVTWLGGRQDVAQLLQAADALVHPAYSENTGNVILESIVAGLPVMATDVCGYAHYIGDAGAGLVCPSPWDSQQATRLLEELLTSDQRESWRANGIAFGQQNDFYHRAEYAAKIIEESCSK